MFKSNLIGKRFDRLVVVARVGARWVCACDCGNEKITIASRLTSQHVRSCGCLHRDTTAARSTIHGHAQRGMKRDPEYRTWTGMRARCNDRNHIGYNLYGGRGITICSRWDDFSLFLLDMGKKPSPQHSLDRMDSNGNYEPGNCRWATIAEQNANKRGLRCVTIGGETAPVCEFARRMGVKNSLVYRRMRRGWDPVSALTTPLPV